MIEDKIYKRSDLLLKVTKHDNMVIVLTSSEKERAASHVRLAGLEY